MHSIDIFPWNENFNTGVVVIDEQHQKLAQLINLLAGQVAQKANIPALNLIFDELANYAVYHFQTEEAIWHKHLPEDPLERQHKEVHNSFISRVIKLKGAENNKPTGHIVEDLLSFLTRWLASHILETDRYMAMVVLAMQSGESLENAKKLAAEKMSGTMRVLIDIILSTYGNHVTNTLHLMREISDRQQAENALTISHKAQEEGLARIQSLVDSALDAIVSMDQDGNVIDWNPQAEVIFGYAREYAIGQEVAVLVVPPLHREAHRQGMARFINTCSSTTIGKRMEIVAMRSDGSEFPVELTITALIQNKKHVFSAYVRDITDRKKHEEAIYDFAFYDPLTHLPNRRLMLDRLKQTLLSSARLKRCSAILFINLDDFKALNSTQGHDVGDLMLIEVAKRLQDHLYGNDTVARLGGDEFAVVLDLLNVESDLAPIQARNIAEKLLTAIARPIVLHGSDHHCSASIGITLSRDNEITADELLQHADTAMHQAKKQGRNSIKFFDPATQAALESRVQMETWMRKAIPDEFRLYYQLQVDQVGFAHCAEVLIRWLHPKKGMISPADFIPLAEETGLIIPIGHWVLQTACRQLKTWESNSKTRHLALAVNVSANQLHQPDFVDQVLAVVEGTGADPSKLKLELTESLLVNNVEDIIHKMTALKTKGIKFSLDDFGTGFSSLSYLKRLPLDQLKIDQSFVRDALTDPNDAAIVRTIIALGQSMGLDVIAEGVETKEQRDFLAVHGCQHYQGYLFSMPIPIIEFETLLSKS